MSLQTQPDKYNDYANYWSPSVIPVARKRTHRIVRCVTAESLCITGESVAWLITDLQSEKPIKTLQISFRLVDLSLTTQLDSLLDGLWSSESEQSLSGLKL